MLHGMINVYKERGYTSHDVVAKLRGILGQKKIGHTGTLDPEAEGVLPVCLGAGTRLMDMLTDTDKTYRAVMLLGKTTDTQDITGTVLKTSGDLPAGEEVRAAALRFLGVYEQVPPMYSALKVNGKKLYELAREGKTVERKARPVQIYEIRIERIDLPRVTMTVSCSKGTYIRTLCHDMGEALGCGGCMEELTRLRAGVFSVEESRKLSEIEALQKEGRVQEAVVPVDAMFPDAPALRTTAAGDKFLYNGNELTPEQISGGASKWPEAAAAKNTTGDAQVFVRLYDSRGNFCALYRPDAKKRRYRPAKMFLTGKDGGQNDR